ncbi:MAG: hypothetical protein HGA84_04695 [Syntrophobacteraceae bacterium]|nr:hypothetical protein [Syntrophobacteraceae bacterium]
MNPILIEVIMPTFSNLEIGCWGCDMILNDLGLKGQDRETCTDEYPAEWRERMGLLNGRINEILKVYHHRVHVRFIDAQSPLGLWKQIRHWIFTYPAWIIDSRATYAGWDGRELKSLIEMRIRTMGESDS